MGVSKKLRAGLAIAAVLASCQLVGCGSDTVDGGGAGESGADNVAGKAGSSHAGKAGMNGKAGAGHAGEAEAGMAGEVEMGGGAEAGGTSGGSASLGTAGGGSGGLANGGKGGGGGTSGAAGKGGGGGASSGAAGANAGAATGGAGAGTGGAGGATAGAGGAGAGGASAGTGGAAAGTGGGGTAICGNNVLETGEICDPKFSKNDCGSNCKAITSTTCLACESACAGSLLTCDTATGGTTTATVTGSSAAAKSTDPNPVTTPVGSPKAPLCNEVLDCVRDSGCAADRKPALKSCYCGTATVPQCNSGMGNGPCKAELERALETTDFATVSQRVGDALYGGGVAMIRIDCDQSFCGEDYQGCF